MAISLLCPDDIARFCVDLAVLTDDAPGRLGIAVSGGPDSVALLLLAHAAFPGTVAAATVDHRLRAESADEAAFVAGICATLGVPHRILAADEVIEGNIQSGARALRYRLLARWAEEEGIGWVLTAHHADDQAETLLMRLMRGAGLAGLAGIRAAGRVAGQRVARPLLGWRRTELESIVSDAGLVPVDDPGNADPAYDRARLRATLAEVDWVEVTAVAHSAAALAKANDALDWAADALQADRVHFDGDAVSLDPDNVPSELRRRLVLRILGELAPDAAPRGAEVQRLLVTLDAGGTATLAGVKCSGGARWRFAAAPPRR